MQQFSAHMFLSCLPSILSFRAVNREVRGHGHMEFPWKLIDRSVDSVPLTSGLLDHQLDVLIIENTDQVAILVPVVQGNVFHLEDIPEKEEKFDLQQKKEHKFDKKDPILCILV